MKLLVGKKVSLRALEPGDLEILYQWENEPAIWSLSNTLAPYSRYTLEKFIEDSQTDIYQSRQLRLVIVEQGSGRAIGAVDLFDFDPFHQRAGIGILIHDKKDRNKGFATDAIRLLIEYAFSHLGLHQLYCNISESNTLSMALFTGLGFRVIGLKKDWLRCSRTFESEYMLQLINPSSASW